MPSEAASQIQVHSVHLVLFGVWFAIFAGVYLRARLTARRHAAARSTKTIRSKALGWTLAVAACSVVAAATHLAVIGEHFEESFLYGMFFLLLTGQQLVFAAWVVWRPTPALVRASGLAALAVALLWLATRTTGIPVGPAAGEVEPVGTLDVIASTAELLLAVLCVPAGRALVPVAKTSLLPRRMSGMASSVND